MTRKKLQEKYSIFGENKDIIPFDCSLKEQTCDAEHPNRRYKVRTKAGCPVTIVKWDAVGLYPIHGRFLDGETETWTEDGYYDIIPYANDYDLVLVDTQPTQSLELNEFEKRLCESLLIWRKTIREK